MGIRTGLRSNLLSACGLIALTAIFALTSAAESAEVSAKAAEAENLLQSGQAAAAFEAMDTAVDAFWSEAPLILAKARIVTDGPAASTPTITPAKPVTVHVEPRGYGFREADGEFRIGLSFGTEIRTPGGLILAKSDDLGRLQWSGPFKNRAFSGRITIDMGEMKPGDYELWLTLTDDASGKDASATLPFSIATE